MACESKLLAGIRGRAIAYVFAVAGVLIAIERRAFALTDQPNLPVPNVADGVVRAIARSGNTVYFAGSFTTVDGQARNRLAAFNATTGALLSWNPGANGEVRALAISGSTIYAGGQFTTVNGSVSRSCAAAFNASGSALAWNPNIGGPARVVTDLDISGSTIYLVGDFTTVNGSVARNDGAAFDLTAGNATGWNPNASGGANPHIHAVALSASAAYIGGEFAAIGGSARVSLAAVNLSSGAPLSWNAGLGGTPAAIETLLISGSTLYVGGRFSSFANGSQTRFNLGSVSASDAQTIDWRPNPNGETLVVALLGSSVFAGGDFTNVNLTVPKLRLAEFGASISQSTAWNPAINGRVHAIHAASDRIFVGGAFTNAGGVTVGRLAGYNPASVSTPTITPTASPTSGPTGTVSVSPTKTASLVPTLSPTAFPTASATPVASPTVSPTPAPTNFAAPQGHTVPGEIHQSARVHAGVSMRNTGGTLWTAVAGHQLAILEDDCGLTSPPLAAITLAEDLLIPPGGSHQFVVTLNAPASPANCTLRFRMEQALWGEFGTEAEMQVKIVPLANDAIEWELYE